MFRFEPRTCEATMLSTVALYHNVALLLFVVHYIIIKILHNNIAHNIMPTGTDKFKL